MQGPPALVRRPVSPQLLEQQVGNGSALLQRSSGMGFIPPVVAAPAAVELISIVKWTAVAGIAWLISRGLLNWGSINSPRTQLGPAETVPLWWPKGTYSPTGSNTLTFTVEMTTVHPSNDCQPRTGTQTHAAFGGVGLLNYQAWDELPPDVTGPCGNRQAAEVNVGWINADGSKAGIARIGTNEFVSRAAIIEMRVSPSGDEPAAAPYPEWKPSVQPRNDPRLIPLPAAPRPQTIPNPATAPEPARVPDVIPAAPPVPVVPGQVKKAPPQIGVPGRPGPVRIPGGQEIGSDGAVKQLPVPGPATTPTDQEIPWPGGQPIGSPAQQPRPTLTGIAQEVGRIEKKLAQMNLPKGLPKGADPFDWADALGKLWELFNAINSAGSYGLWSPCVDAGQPGSASDPMMQRWGSSIGWFGALEKRLDAIAGLLQDGKVLPQPTCMPEPARPTGMPIVVRFVSDEVSPYGERPLRKILSYRSQSGVDLRSHTDHWRGFTWTSGTWMVLSQGLDWGQPQVWAATPEEGRRVLQHAASIAGVDLSDPRHRFVERPVQSARINPNLLMRVKRDAAGRLWVTTRDGSAGLPMLLGD